MAGKRARTIALVDYDGQQGVVELPMPYTKVPLIEDIQWATFKAALAGITLGTLSRETDTSALQLVSSGTKSADPVAQRQTKWLVSYTDITQWLDAPTNSIANPNHLRVFQTEIPTADLSLRINNNEVIYNGGDPATAGVAMEAFIDAFTAIVRSPSGGAIQVLQVKAHSRNV